MSNNEQSKALRLADAIDRYNAGVYSQSIYEDYAKAAAELRRLHAMNQGLLEALEDLSVSALLVKYQADNSGRTPWTDWDSACGDLYLKLESAKAAIAKATGGGK